MDIFSVIAYLPSSAASQSEGLLRLKFFYRRKPAGTFSAVFKRACSQWMEKFLLHNKEKINISLQS